MENLKGMSVGVFQYIENIEPFHRSKAHFQTQFKGDILSDNWCKCFNSHILKARIKGIITMN